MSIGTLSAALLSAPENPHASAGMRVYSALREEILSLDLLPDTTLSRAEIARRFGFSQSPVREAIQRLEMEGLVISYPQSRTVVSKIDVAHARETQFLRMGVELEVANTLAQRRDSALLAPTLRLLRMQELAAEDQDVTEFNMLDRLFHLSLFEAAGVRALWHLIADRSGHIDRLRRLTLPDPGKIAEVILHHEQILAAISSGDKNAVEKAVRTHLSGTLASVQKIMAERPHFF